MIAADVRTIEPRPTGLRQQLRELRQGRAVLGYFARRAIMRRYARTWLGRSWLILRPGLAIIAQVFVFGGILGIRAGVPYVIFFLVAVSAWHLFSELAYWSTRSLEVNRRSLRTMYVPRLTLLLAAVAPAVLDYLVYLSFLAIALSYYLITQGHFYLDLGVNTLATLAGLALLIVFALGIGLWLSVFALQARDVRFGLRFGLSFLYFFTPVIYPLSQVPAKYRTIAEVNPLTFPIELVKYGLLGTPELPATAALATAIGLVVVVGCGLVFFIRAESVALDHV